MKKNKIALFTILLIFILVLNGCTAAVSENVITNDRLIVTYLDVGQADCILIQEPLGETMMIDTGNNNDSEYIIDYLSKTKVKKIDFLIGTHPHEDHIGSMDKVIDNFDIGTIYMPKKIVTTKTFEDVLKSIKNKNLKVISPIPGTVFYLGKAKCTILSPISDKYDETNNYSITLKVQYGETSFLFTGDAEKESEQEMLQMWGNDLKSDILKVGHHGSSSSSIDQFLEKVNPSLVVISVGKDNDYNHPHKETLEKFNKLNVPVLRTDELGNIILTSDGNNIYKQDNTKINILNSLNIEQKDLPNIVIQNIDKTNEIVILKNDESVDVDMSNWVMVSVSGKDTQTFTLPEGTVIKANSTLTLASGKANGDVKLTTSNIWNNSKSDPGELYNEKNELVSIWDD